MPAKASAWALQDLRPPSLRCGDPTSLLLYNQRRTDGLWKTPKPHGSIIKTGRTPAKAVEVMRLEAARRLLEDSERNIDQIAGCADLSVKNGCALPFNAA